MVATDIKSDAPAILVVSRWSGDEYAANTLGSSRSGERRGSTETEVQSSDVPIGGVKIWFLRQTQETI